MSILVLAPINAALAEELFTGMLLKVVTGIRYLGGFIMEGEAEKMWLAGKVAVCVDFVETLAGFSSKHPQSAYAGL